jgi:phage shock protein A
MGIMTRMLRLCKADVHGVMDQLEDKGLLLKQYLREMEASLGDKQRQINALVQRHGRLKGQIVRHGEEMDRLERDLTLALKKEKDDIARMLIRRRRSLAAASRHLKEQVETITQEKTQLSETSANQRLQYETLKARADAYCHQAADRLFESATHQHVGAIYADHPIDEEIELELLERKEALQEGGNP